jgi:hypothetical protein
MLTQLSSAGTLPKSEPIHYAVLNFARKKEEQQNEFCLQNSAQFMPDIGVARGSMLSRPGMAPNAIRKTEALLGKNYIATREAQARCRHCCRPDAR